MKPTRDKSFERTSVKASRQAWRRRSAMAALALALSLSMSSCGRSDEGPLPPHSPPKPTTLFGADLTHAHYRLPAPPVPPKPGMM